MKMSVINYVVFLTLQNGQMGIPYFFRCNRQPCCRVTGVDRVNQFLLPLFQNRYLLCRIRTPQIAGHVIRRFGRVRELTYSYGAEAFNSFKWGPDLRGVFTTEGYFSQGWQAMFKPAGEKSGDG